MTHASPLISVIIPVYNAAEYLQRCVDSVLTQRYENIELILVDDGSEDGSSALCDLYAASDKRVVAIHQENGGVSTARNKGIERARGEYISFVDADDYVDEDYIQTFLRACDDDQIPDIVLQGLTEFYGERMGKVVCLPAQKTSALRSFMSDTHIVFCGPVCKLFKTPIIRNHQILFPEGINHAEDAIFYYTYLLHANTGAVSDAGHYFYQRGVKSSLTNKKQGLHTLVERAEQLICLRRHLVNECGYRLETTTVISRGMLITILYLSYQQGGLACLSAAVKNIAISEYLQPRFLCRHRQIQRFAVCSVGSYIVAVCTRIYFFIKKYH